MANFEISKRIQTNTEIKSETIRAFIKERLSKSSKYEIISESDDLLVIEGRIKETVLTPVVKFRASFEIKSDNNKTRLYIDISSGITWVFWVMFALGILSYGVLLVVTFGLFFTQTNKPQKTIGRALEAVETEFGAM